MALTNTFSDAELISQLRMQFEREEMFDLDWKTIFNQIQEREKDYYLRFRRREFSIDKVTGAVTEVTK